MTNILIYVISGLVLLSSGALRRDIMSSREHSIADIFTFVEFDHGMQSNLFEL